MTSTTQPKPFDCVESMREIRNRISAEIADMSYSELSQWLAEQVRDDPFFSRIPKPGQPGRPPVDRTGVCEGSSTDVGTEHRTGR